ncbi:MAG: MFS transporter [Kiritimatiellia bacterium]|nr:MFS transporter [Kiritimatiellia bacterium]
MNVPQSDWKILPRFQRIFRSLGYRNFRLFFVGQGISLTGTWMQMIAVGWLAYELTKGQPEGVRAVWLGIVGFTGRIPTFILAPLAGVLVDRWDRRNLVIAMQILSMIQAALLATLTLLHTITMGQLILLSLMLGLINAFDIPARQSFMIETVDKPNDLSNAIALNSSMFNVARIIGPAIGGVLLKVVGTGYCFLFNAVSYIAVITALLAMVVKPSGRLVVTGHVLKNMTEGIRYAFGFPPVRNILLLLMVISLSGASYPVLLPIFSSNILHQGSGLYALLFAAAGFGALIGALFLAVRESVRGLLGWITAAPVIFGMGLIILGLSRWTWLSVLAMPVIGFGLLTQAAASNTVIQTIIADHMRGRVMSFYSMAFMGMMPLGSLLSGMMSRLVGAPVTIMLNGLLCIAAALVFFRYLKMLRRHINPIYVKKGIISEDAVRIPND